MSLAFLGVLACVSCGSSPARPDAASVTACLRAHNAFLQRETSPSGVPPSRAILEFGFAARPAPLNRDSGEIILTNNPKDVDRWVAFLRSLDPSPVTRAPFGALIAWNNHSSGHPVTRTILTSCIRTAAREGG